MCSRFTRVFGYYEIEEFFSIFSILFYLIIFFCFPLKRNTSIYVDGSVIQKFSQFFPRSENVSMIFGWLFFIWWSVFEDRCRHGVQANWNGSFVWINGKRPNGWCFVSPQQRITEFEMNISFRYLHNLTAANIRKSSIFMYFISIRNLFCQNYSLQTHNKKTKKQNFFLSVFFF